ncbi:MAG: DUF4097 family beta strand repeat protein [Actinomycetales bacterium]|uniref:DUF4097 family beta strand repeat protein n=1 Tax=Candidatus Phosphoribacter hodrii TaxID=2953743 RepID=A0A935CDU3_9MICO|nr:DUF4097 family beta strand repeat protein [Candidatus Phosphoribacter hodrii]
MNPATPQDAPPPGASDATTPTTSSSPSHGQPPSHAPASIVDPSRNVPERGLWVAAGMALVAMAVGGAWFGAWVDGHQVHATQTATYAAGSIDLRNLGDHNVNINGSNRSDILVTRRVTWVGSSDAPPAPREAVTDSTLVIDNPCDSVGLTCSVDYRIEVPLTAAVHWAAGSGDLYAANVTSVVAKGSSSDITLREVGIVDVTTMSGDVDLCGSDTSLAVQTQSGEVDACDVTAASVVIATASGDVRFDGGPEVAIIRTASGDVTVTLTAQERYDLMASSSSGEVDVEAVPDRASSRTLDVTTSSGDITVR